MRVRRRPALHGAHPIGRALRSDTDRLSRAHAAKAGLDRVATLAFAGTWTAAAARQLASGLPLEHAPVALAGALVGYLLADLVAGLVHWLADRHLDPATPLVGPLLIAPFRAHHDDPLSITRHDLFEVLGNNALVTLPVAAALVFAPPPGSALGFFVIGLGLAGCLAAVLTNLFHAWAHAPSPPRIARWLQRAHLVLTPRAHARHHCAPHDVAYCVTSGWLNPGLDRLRFFSRLDARIASALERRSADRLGSSGGSRIDEAPR